ncbi:MAG: 3-methyl-2-oxobutanoate hydroxymethyltransferase [Candidatus Kapaibacteriales bacterium]
MKSINEFQSSKQKGIPISMVTCYDYWSAKIISETEIDAVLVGDSAAMVMHGYESTINAEIDMMLYHISSVKKGLKNKLLIADFPFLAHRKGSAFAIDVADKFMKNGANAVKIEGADSSLNIIKDLVESGIPVIGHLGLTPQHINKIGGYIVQGKNSDASKKITEDAFKLQEAGCFAIVLELVPSSLAKEITERLNIPTIGIGAGKFTSGQILVLHDLLGLLDNFHPKFVRKYLNGYELIKAALKNFHSDVISKSFPNEMESFQ